MRQGQNQGNRNRNRNRPRHRSTSGGSSNNSGGNSANKVFDSNGPDVKLRGTSQTVAEKYMQLGRDAQSSGDSVSAESYYQHAEHYYRMWAANQPAGASLLMSRKLGEEEFEEDGEGGEDEGAEGQGNESVAAEGTETTETSLQEGQDGQPRQPNNNRNNNNNSGTNNRERFKPRWQQRRDRPQNQPEGGPDEPNKRRTRRLNKLPLPLSKYQLQQLASGKRQVSCSAQRQRLRLKWRARIVCQLSHRAVPRVHAVNGRSQLHPPPMMFLRAINQHWRGSITHVSWRSGPGSIATLESAHTLLTSL